MNKTWLTRCRTAKVSLQVREQNRITFYVLPLEIFLSNDASGYLGSLVEILFSLKLKNAVEPKCSWYLILFNVAFWKFGL